jgi:hypothetical protein
MKIASKRRLERQQLESLRAAAAQSQAQAASGATGERGAGTDDRS